MKKTTTSLRYVIKITAVIIGFLLLAPIAIGQINPSDGCGAAPVLSVNLNCVANTYTLPGAYNNGAQYGNTSCNPGNDRDDGWYQFVATTTTTYIDLNSGDRAHVLAVYSGACGSLTELGCDPQAAGTTATVAVPTTIGVTYYIQVHRANGNDTATMTGDVCVYETPSGGGGGGAPDDPWPGLDLGVISCAGVTTVSGTTVGATIDCSQSSSGDHIYQFTLGVTSDITIDVCGATWDTQIHLYDIANGACDASVIESNDDGCGVQSTITRTCLPAGTYVLVMEGYSSNEGAYDLNFTTFNCACVIPTGSLCSDPDIIPALPYSNSGLTTCGFGDDYSSANACGNTYMNGDDYIFEYTSPGNECLNISLTNTGTWVGVFVMDGCPDAGGTSCIGSATESGGNPTASVTISAAGTYYIVISTNPSPQCTPFDIDVTSNPAGMPGTDCTNPLVIGAAPYVQTGMNTGCFGDDYDSGDACGSSYLNGDDFVFEYTPGADISMDLTLTNTGNSVGLFVFDGCPSSGGTSCIDEASGTNPNLTCVNLLGGTTYYIVVSTWPTPQSTAFDFDMTPSPNGGEAPTCNLDYTMSLISYSPANYNTGTSVIFDDDRFADAYISIGFDFCFDGIMYNNLLVSSNGYLIFPGCYSEAPSNGPPVPGGPSEYTISAAIPNTTDAPRNAILLTWQDIDPSVSGDVRYTTTGTTPNQIFTVKFDDVAMYSCNSLLYSGQVMLYETSNNIEFHIGEKTVCSTWNGGDAILGLHNYDGTQAVTNAGHNYPTNWTETSEGYLFTPNCPNCALILSVELEDLKVVEQDRTNVLTWKTVSEENNDHFIIERAGDEFSFYPIGEVDGAGTSLEELEYMYIDEFPLNGTNYYRLRQVDNNGTWSYSSIVSVDNWNQEISVYPNPTEGSAMIKINSKMANEYKVIISSVVGSILEKVIKINQGQTILELVELSEFSNGIYILRIEDANGDIIFTEKIVKQ